MKDRFIVFTHIEKNGGITLHNILHSSYLGYVTPRPNYGVNFSSKDLNKLQKIYPIKISGIGGHRINPIENYHPDQFLFTFLRNPIERYLSHLNYQISRIGINWNIEEFLENPYFNNFQTYRISKNRDLELAIDIINERFSFIGLMENYELSLNYLSVLLDNPQIRKKYKKRNVSVEKHKIYRLEDLNRSIKNKIIENNNIDLALYNYVKNNVFSEYQNKFKNIQFEKDIITKGSYIETLTNIKRKISNIYIGRIVQPIILHQDEVLRGI